MQGNFASIKDLVKQCPFKRKFHVCRLKSVASHIGLSMSTIKSCVECKQQKTQTRDAGMPQGGIQELRTNETEARMPQGNKEERRKESIPRTASCASASLGENFPVASTGRSVKDAVPGREDGKNVVTQDDMQPPKANGGLHLLDTWSLTLTSPSSTRSISPSTTSIYARENAAKSSGRK